MTRKEWQQDGRVDFVAGDLLVLSTDEVNEFAHVYKELSATFQREQPEQELARLDASKRSENPEGVADAMLTTNYLCNILGIFDLTQY